jgi:hypothetical protein
MLIAPLVHVLHIFDGSLLHLCLNWTEIPLWWCCCPHFIYVMLGAGRAFPESWCLVLLLYVCVCRSPVESNQEGDWPARRLDQRPGDGGDLEDSRGALRGWRGQQQRQLWPESLRPCKKEILPLPCNFLVFLSFHLRDETAIEYHSRQNGVYIV